MVDNFVMEEREERMVSRNGTDVCSRIGHFLTPSVTSIDGVVAAPQVSYCSIVAPRAANYKDLPFEIIYSGWKSPSKNWKLWVDQLKCSHQSTWKKSGILNAILNSTCIIHRYDDLLLRFVEKWCPTTNSFVFPWGEATITLEDVMVVGGFPVLGESVSTPPTREMEETVAELQKARSSISKTKAKKALLGMWMTRFMGSRCEIEHEAFLAYWLSKFVFPFSRDAVYSNVVSIAVHLARGNRIALAPSVLACIYKSLSLLRTGIVAARKSGTKKVNNGVVEVIVPAPLGLVQVWIWERFPALRPRPKFAEANEVRLARWHNLKSGLRYESMNMDCTGEDFQWRPYVDCNGRDDERWEVVDSGLDEDLEGWVRCVRVSELVSLEENCTEQYLPHRVAMQFGMDQDLPGHVERVNGTPQVAWSDYTRRIRDAKLYIPSCLYEPRVTMRYLIWWKEMILGSGDPSGDGKNLEEVNVDLFGRKSEDDYDFLPQPPGFSIKWKKVVETEDNEGGVNSCKDSKRRRKFVASSSRERSAAAHSQTDVDSASYGKAQSEDDAEGENHSDQSEKSATPDNGDDNEEEMLLVEPVESDVERMVAAEEAQIDEPDEKIGASSSQVEGNRIRAVRPLENELEKRISTIEKLVAYLEARKLDCL